MAVDLLRLAAPVACSSAGFLGPALDDRDDVAVLMLSFGFDWRAVSQAAVTVSGCDALVGKGSGEGQQAEPSRRQRSGRCSASPARQAQRPRLNSG
jgi:hypothetical protein